MTRHPKCLPAHSSHREFNLLADVVEALVFSDELVRLSKHWVEGLVAVPECGRGVSRDGKGSNVDLEQIQYQHSASGPQVARRTPRYLSVGLQPHWWASLCISSYHPLVGVCRAVGSVQELAVFQLLAQSLQQVHRFIEGGRHGHSSQVFT